MAKVSGARVVADGGGVALIVSVAHTAHDKYSAVERLADRYAARSGTALPMRIKRVIIGTMDTPSGCVSSYAYAATEAGAQMVADTARGA